MNIEHQGVEATLEADGTLNLVSDKVLRVRLNGYMLGGAPEQKTIKQPAQQFWTKDGTQTSERPTDLRGEVR